MTITAWLSATDPSDLDLMLPQPLSDRKTRLFGCAAARVLWDILPVDVLRQAIETCERFADGLASGEELEIACTGARQACRGIGDIIADHSAMAVEALCQPEPRFLMDYGSDGGFAAVAAEAWSDVGDIEFDDAWNQAKREQADLMREVVGNPFAPVEFHSQWRTPEVLRVAEEAYADRELPSGRLHAERLRELADALERAGCTAGEIVSHLRRPCVHVRGCWALDLVLGRP